MSGDRHDRHVIMRLAIREQASNIDTDWQRPSRQGRMELDSDWMEQENVLTV